MKTGALPMTAGYLTREEERDRRLRAASAYLKEGAFKEAIDALHTVLAIDAGDEVTLGLLGAIHAELNCPESAIACFDGVLKLNPDNHLARFQLSLACQGQRQPGEALEAWKRCLRETDDYVVHYHSALALMKLDQVEQARFMLHRAAEHMPTQHELYPMLLQMIQLTNLLM